MNSLVSYCTIRWCCVNCVNKLNEPKQRLKGSVNRIHVLDHVLCYISLVDLWQHSVCAVSTHISETIEDQFFIVCVS